METVRDGVRVADDGRAAERQYDVLCLAQGTIRVDVRNTSALEGTDSWCCVILDIATAERLVFALQREIKTARRAPERGKAVAED